MKEFSLQGRTALVTGSTMGIGRGIADIILQAGGKVLFHSLEERPEDLAAGAVHFQSDLSKAGASEELIEKAFEAAPNLDLLVSNAGGFFDLPFADMDETRWNSTIDLNLKAPFFLIQKFAGRLVDARKSGSVVVVASTNAFQGERESAAYDASKGGLVSLVRALALDFAPHRIRINAVAPGVIRTPLTRRWIDTEPKMKAHYEANIPLGRIGEPGDIAGAAVFLLSEASAYMTGQTIVIDGGLTAQQIGPW